MPPKGSYFAVCIVAVACAKAGAPAEKKPAMAVHANVEPNPRNSIGALVNVTAPGASEAWVEHGDTPAYGERTRAAAVPASGALVIPIIGLTPEATTHLRVHAAGPGGRTTETKDLTFRAGSLPPDVPRSISVTTASKIPGGYFLVGLYDDTKEAYVAAMFDREGRTRWYWAAPLHASAAAEFNRLGANFVVIDSSKDQVLELDLASNVVKTWRNAGSVQGLDAHDFVLLPNGNAIMFGWDYRTVDTRSLFPRGVKNAIRADHTIDEIDPGGNVLFHWSSHDHVELDETMPWKDFDPTNFQVVHANSLEVLPDGNILASFRETSSIVKIVRPSGAVVWRLGGKKSDFTFVGDQFSGFSRQHDAHFLETGELMLFDNGNDHVPRSSRVVRYRLDESARTATLTWAYYHHIFCAIAGSARRLPNGHTLVGWPTGVITEVDDSQATVWEATTKPLALYRALYVPTLYP